MVVATRRQRLKFTEFAVADKTVVGIVPIRAMLSDHLTAMRLLGENGYAPLTSQQAFTLIRGDLEELLKGYGDFWLAGKGIDVAEGIHITDSKGELREHTGSLFENTGSQVYVRPGTEPLKLLVREGAYTFGGAGFFGRFVLYANHGPGTLTGALVGIKEVQAYPKGIRDPDLNLIALRRSQDAALVYGW
ncbi:MAG: hypothetical protein KGH72_05870 [Candidatus Micrarchaeota archaeon]|nr:hypothetical protein [Candidatus Micrarchaeota archaeon]